jgi:hypothetical protein
MTEHVDSLEKTPVGGRPVRLPPLLLTRADEVTE